MNLFISLSSSVMGEKIYNCFVNKQSNNISKYNIFDETQVECSNEGV